MRNAALLTLAFFCFFSTFATAAEDTVRISTSYKTLLSTPEQTGMLDRIVKEAFQRIGMTAEIVFTANERSLVAVNDGLYDGEINRIAGMEKDYPNLVRVPEPNMVMHFVAFATRDIPVSGWESLRPLRAGMVKGWKILERNTVGFPNVVHVMSADQLFKMLNLDRIDVAVYSKLGGYELVDSLKLHNIRHLEPPLASRDMFLYLHKDHRTLAEPVAAALREMKLDGTYERIVRETTGFLPR